MTTAKATAARHQAAGELETLLDQLAQRCRRPWVLMELCGGQTHAILRNGLDQRLPPHLELIHGPGCPVCVTASSLLDRALALALAPDVLLCSYGDMLRVPGSHGVDLLSLRARGAAVRVVYSPLDVLELARRHPERTVVFLAVGFETTAPATALLARRALAEAIPNLRLLVGHVRVPPVLEVLLAHPDCRVQGILAAGHVCTVMGQGEYTAIAARHRRPIVVTGFEPLDLVRGILACVEQLERGDHRVENGYRRAAHDRGNPSAQALLHDVFEVVDQEWRGLGMIPAGGLALRGPYRLLDATHLPLPLPLPLGTVGPSAPGETRAEGPADGPPEGPPEGQATCISGLVLQGLASPPSCPSYGNRCTPDHPLGAPMVSAEGACAAHFRYRG